MAKRKLPKQVTLPLGEVPKYHQSYFLYSGNSTFNTWLLKRAYPAKARADLEQANLREWRSARPLKV
jgi:hypothetical protein